MIRQTRSTRLQTDTYPDDYVALQANREVSSHPFQQSHVTKLLVKNYHMEVKHQGWLFTEGAIRAARPWIVAGKRLVSSILQLRCKLEMQKMADLPPERLHTSLPFSYMELDVFGPWTVVTQHTRGGAAHSKRWAILFTYEYQERTHRSYGIYGYCQLHQCIVKVF